MTTPKGLIVFYVNRDECLDEEQSLKEITKANKEFIEQAAQNGYSTLIIPTEPDSSRIEKIDFDKPFPLYPPQNDSKPKELKKKEQSDG